MGQEKPNKIKEIKDNISSYIDRYIYDAKAIIDIRGLYIFLAFSLILAATFFFNVTYVQYLLIKILFIYLMIIFSYSSVLLLISIILRKQKKVKKTFFDKIFKKLIWVFLIVFIPILVVIKVIDFLINFRAKKSDNIEIILFILIIDLVIFQNFLGLDSNWITVVYKFISNIAFHRFSMVIEEFPFELLLILCSFKIVVDFTNFFLLVALRGYGIYSIKKSVKMHKDLKVSSFRPEDDINEHLIKIQEYEESQKDELKYDLFYFRKALIRPQLLILVGMFVIVALAPTYFFPKDFQSDAINVLTIFTLVILLIDKNKEWNKELEKLSDKLSEKIRRKIKTNDKDEKQKIILEK